MILIYRILASVIYALVYPYGLSRAEEGDKLWTGRLGQLEKVESVDIWLHAASVGEVKVISYLIAYLKRANPALNLHATTMTRTGYKTAESLLKKQASLSFFPLDAPRPLTKTLDMLKPKIIVMAETEIWPNLIVEASKRDIKLILVNGRMSSGSFGKYRLIKRTLTKLLSKYDHFFYKSVEDQNRYSNFSIPEFNSTVSGDMKFDAPPTIISEGRRREIRNRLGVDENQFLYVAGSTRQGEEQMLLEGYQKLKANIPGYKMVIVPRHIERTEDIQILCKQMRISCDLYSNSKKSIKSGFNCDNILLIDQMGILNELYMAADLAFVGGTLVDIGGHNILEPIWSHTPVLFGPYVANVSEAAEHIISNNYGKMVNSPKELVEVIIQFANKKIIFDYRRDHTFNFSATAIAGAYILKLLEGSN